MFLSSKSPPLMTSGAATCFPDLSLQISPPAASVTGCITKRPRSSSSTGSDLSQENKFHHHQKSWAAADHICHQFDQPQLSLGLEIGALNHHRHLNINTVPSQPQHHRYHLPRIYGHDFRRRSRMVNFARRSTRAPRMRWTSTLHAHFIHAVQLLGGHERATPKSVQELMNVKDLTLAHVKSHLQMYRTVKGTDKVAAAGLLADQMQVINSKTPLTFLEVRGDISVSPSTALQSQSCRRSSTSSLETNDSYYPMRENTSSHHCPSPIMNDSTKADEVEMVTLQYLSKKMKLRSNPSSLASEKLLNLEFTLGSRQMDHTF